MPLPYPHFGPSVIGHEVTRSTLDLLRQPFVYSQSNLLSPAQFIAEAKKRGLSLQHGELEVLHRRRILVPFYRIHQRAITTGEDRSPAHQVPGAAWQLYRASAQGRLGDPETQRFTRWPSQRSGPRLYYSHYQLLGLRSLQRVLTEMKGYSDSSRVVWELDRLTHQQRSWHAQSRALAIVLEALSPRYRPRVMQVLRSPEASLISFVDNHDPLVESQFLAIENELLLRQAEILLNDASSFDPLGTWHRVTRIANPRRWEELRNDALIAHEQRVGAEIVLQYLEDQAVQGRARPLDPVSTKSREPLHGRLQVDQRERAETIMDFRLSDRPALYLAVEGQTEVTIVSKVLDLVGFEAWSSWIRVVDIEGVGGDVNLLARAVAVPFLDPQGHRGARVTSPLSALVVVADPEGRYRTAELCAAVRAKMIEHVLKSLPRGLRTDEMRRDLDHLVHVWNWKAEFEFAHFSNIELAKAIRSVAGPTCPPLGDIRKALQRTRDSGGTIKNVWKNWKQKPSKVDLAEKLWPGLEKRILNPRHRRAIPVVDIVMEAITISDEIRSTREMAADD